MTGLYLGVNETTDVLDLDMLQEDRTALLSKLMWISMTLNWKGLLKLWRILSRASCPIHIPCYQDGEKSPYVLGKLLELTILTHSLEA